jgi:hypothetical protein
MGGNPTDESSWIICSYCSPFAGCNDITKIPNYTTNTQIAQQSYGMWMVPPDLNNEVAVFFATGRTNRAYWFGCCYQQSMNKMIPGIAVDVTTEPQPPVHVSPVTEYNKSDKTLNVDNPRRPPFLPLTNGLNTEGLTTDLERGSSSTSARRETPSFVYGLLSPRGNTIHIDDNHTGDSVTGTSVNEFIRLRTRSGTQVLIDETTGMVYINSKLGNAWLEVSDAGVDVYSSNSVSIRAQQDLNVRADRNILLDAGGTISMRAGSNITMEAIGEMDIHAKGNINAASDSSISVSAASQMTTATGGDFQVGAHGNLVLTSGGSTNLKAGGDQNRDGAAIFDNGGKASSATSPTNPTVPSPKVVNDTTQGFSNGGSGATVWKSGGGTVSTIVSRMPTHEPWFGHPNSKVPPPPLTNAVPNNGGNNGPAANSTSNPSNINNQGCSFGAANTKPISTDVYNAISNASTQTGAPAATMFAIADQESSFNAGAQNPNSSATGLYQMINSTYSGMVSQYGAQYNVATGSQTDPTSNALMGGQLIQNNIQTLQNNGISNPTPGQVYLLHFLGNSGGPSFINQAQSNPDAPASSLFPAAAAANKSLFYNSDGSSKTMGQVYNNITSNIDAKATAYASQYGLPAPCQRGNGTAGNSPSSPATPATTSSAALQSDVGTVYGSGQCVALVQDVTGVGNTSTWQQGQNVQQAVQSGNQPPVGTPIATFGPNGTYTNSLDGTSHAAVVAGYPTDANGNVTGITVLEQYSGQAARLKTYSFNNSSGAVLNNASNYSVINVPNRST